MAESRPRRPRRPRRTSPSVLERINPDAAGIDCGATTHVVAVPPDRDDEPVQSFRTFTTDLQRLADWLVACRVTSVALESTGVFWIPVYEILEARGLAVHLLNARPLSPESATRRSWRGFATAGVGRRPPRSRLR